MRTVKELTRKMKDSGIEWIGEIPEDWEIRKLGNISKLYTGNSIKDNEKDNYISPINAIPYIATKDVGFDNKIDYDNGMYIKKDDGKFKRAYRGNTLVCIEGGSAGRKIAKIESEEVCFGNKLCCINSNVISNNYLYYYSLSPNFINGFQSRITGLIPGVTLLEMAQIEIVVPSKHKQKAIANFLDKKTQEIDNIISKTKKAIEEYKRYKQSLITETVTKGLDKDVEMKDSGIEWVGEIPEHWRITRLKYYLENVKNAIRVGPFGSHLKGEDFVNEGLWVYNQRTVLDRNFETNDTFITAEKYNDMIGFGVEAKDILVTTRGSIGKICRVPEQFEKGIIHPCIIKFKLDDSKFNYRILELIFNESDFVRKQFVILSNSTTIDVIYSETLKNILVPAIPINEQKAIVSYLDKKCSQIDQIISTKEKLLTEMEAYKKSLIYETVTGKREVE